MKKGLFLAASCAVVMGSMASAHAMQPMSGNELRDVSGQGLNGFTVFLTVQRPYLSLGYQPPVVPIRDLLPTFNVNFVPPIVIGGGSVN
jgi:opacity protein-like surface antigen